VLKSILNGLALVLCVSFIATASEKAGQTPVYPVGYFMSNISNADGSEIASHAKFIRDGKEYEAIQGGEVYPGDVVTTDETGGIQIAFLDSSAVRLHESTEFRIEIPTEAKVAGATLSYGHASFGTAPVIAKSNASPRLLLLGDGIINLINLGIGTHNKIAASTLAKFDILITRDPNGTTFTSNVAVLKGSAVLNPIGGNAVQLLFGTSLLMTMNNPVAGVSTNTTVNQGNLTQSQIAALAAVSVSDMTVSVNTNGTVVINTAIRNADGSTTVGSTTEILNGRVTKNSWTTKDANNKTIATWKETDKSIVLSRVFNGYTLKSTVSKTNNSGSATFKGPNGTVYSGTTTVNPLTGIITFNSVAAKDGSTTHYTYNPSGPTGGQQSVVSVGSNGAATMSTVSYNKTTGIRTTTTEQGQWVSGNFVPTPNTLVTTTLNIGTTPFTGSTPDGHGFDQNQPPVTQ